MYLCVSMCTYIHIWMDVCACTESQYNHMLFNGEGQSLTLQQIPGVACLSAIAILV